MAGPSNKLRIGIIGAGEVAQVIHLPTLALLSHLYEITGVCDISPKNAEHCAAKFNIPLATTSPIGLFESTSIDVIMVLTSDEYHEEHIISALKAGKNVMTEKPLTLSIPSGQRIIQAEKDANGPRVFVGYMRRYAASFTEAFKREVGSIPKILYARSRDIIGPNSFFVAQSGTFQEKNTDLSSTAADERKSRLDALFAEAFPEQSITTTHMNYCRFLGGLGSHDLSLMREALGFPESVAGVSVNHPFYSAIFNYRDKTGEPFAVSYETGNDGVPDFDAHLTVYGEGKRVMIKYDTPYIKGLPIKVVVQEANDRGEVQRREIVSSYEDAYTTELREMYDCFVNGKTIKTSAEDALHDLRLCDMMYEKWNKQ